MYISQPKFFTTSVTMASAKATVFVALALSLFVQATCGGVICESLDHGVCAFAVSPSGTRCVLEKRVRRDRDDVEFSCCSSTIEAEPSLANTLETDTCIETCGLDRNTVGISSDALLDGRFAQKLCSSQCYNGCPNIIDLYFNLAVGEGVFLPKICEERTVDALKVMAEIRSSGAAAVSEAVEKLDAEDADTQAETEVISSVAKARRSGLV